MNIWYFTESYHAFCAVLGKTIEHIPSTHSRQDFEKFKQAKMQTLEAYNNNFGKQPEPFWNYPDMHSQLHLRKSKLKINTFLLYGFLGLLLLIFPSFLLLKPLYLTINNPNFIIFYTIILGLVVYFLDRYNKSELHDFLSGLPSDCFIFKLSPDEMLYLEHAKMPDVIHNKINEMVKGDKINIKNKNQLKIKKEFSPNDNIEFTIGEAISHVGKANYNTLLRHLEQRPALLGIVSSMNELRKYFKKSAFFTNLFAINFTIFACFFLLAFVRLCTGIQREKPVLEISIVLIAVCFVSYIFLLRFTQLFESKILPEYYKKKIIPKMAEEEASDWQFFLWRHAVVAASFFPLVAEAQVGNNNLGFGSSGCTSSGSNCSSSSSSCGGSSCGGCGGD